MYNWELFLIFSLYTVIEVVSSNACHFQFNYMTMNCFYFKEFSMFSGLGLCSLGKEDYILVGLDPVVDLPSSLNFQPFKVWDKIGIS